MGAIDDAASAVAVVVVVAVSSAVSSAVAGRPITARRTARYDARASATDARDALGARASGIDASASIYDGIEPAIRDRSSTTRARVRRIGAARRHSTSRAMARDDDDDGDVDATRANAPNVDADARAGDGATEAGAAREREERRRASTRRWLDFVHSKAFRDEVSDVFARASAVHRDDGVMDCTELQFAIDLLHERLREKGANGHAMPRGPRAGRREARELLRDFDLDRDGALDEREFHLLCQRYFSRLEWPMWRVFTRGATIGLALYAAHELWISPLAQNVYWNHFYPKIVQRLKKRYQKRYAGRVNTFLKKFRRPPKKEELLGLERIAQEELKKKRIRRIKAAASASVIGGTTSALGIL